MSIPPLQPDLSAIDAAFVDLVFAFLEQVLHVEKPVRGFIKRMEITETYESMIRRGWYQQWAVTVLLVAAIPGIGDKLFFAIHNHDGHYAIGTLYFQPGWKLQEEQTNVDGV